MKVIFLDFDGVLNSEKYVRNFSGYGVIIDPTRMALLKHIIDKTKAKIVLSTSWREHWEQCTGKCNDTGKEINKIFNEFNLSIFDKTPSIGGNREDEIESWLKSNPETENFVVLDDRFLDSPIIRGHFVKTDNYRSGISEENVNEAIKILN